MNLSRRDFLHLLAGGWAATLPGLKALESTACLLADLDSAWARACLVEQHAANSNTPAAEAATTGNDLSPNASRQITEGEADRILAEVGRFNEGPPGMFHFDENKYSPLKRQIPPSEWASTNRHLPIKLDLNVINGPGERSREALLQVVAYTPFYNPRYVAEPGERVTMCNIAAWDWSRALRLHLPHWKGETEMSANMLFRWVSHPQAGGVYGEGWQPISPTPAQLLANRGVPVFALAENPRPSRHGHVAMVYPSSPVMRPYEGGEVRPYFATVKNGRFRGSNGIKDLSSAFRWMTPTYFVHRHDFIVHPAA